MTPVFAGRLGSRGLRRNLFAGHREHGRSAATV